jgi:Sec-independent protein secretion pathway component TatC
MFYINELKFRVLYCLFACIFLFLIFWYYKHFSLIFFIMLLQKKNIFFITHFIYTHPFELFNIYILVYCCLSIFYIQAYVFMQVLEFFKSSLFEFEYKKIKKIIYKYLFCLLVCNILYYNFLLPNIFEFLNFFNLMSTKILSIKIFYELKIIDYFSLLISTLIFFNIIYFLWFISYFYFFSISLTSLLVKKKLLIFLNLLSATFLSPPDILSQFFYLVFLSIFLEIFFFFKFLSIKNFILYLRFILKS